MFQSMFRSLSRTIELMNTSWRVLMQDRELMLFPILSGIAIIVVAGVFAALAYSVGTFDRISAASAAGSQASFTGADIALGVALAFLVTAVTVFFNTALIAAALERLGGGDPTVRSGLRAAGGNLPAILGWAAIAATVGLLLQTARGQARGGAGAIIMRIGIAIGDTIDAERAAFRIIETLHQLEQGGLAGARRPDHRHGFAGGHRQAEAVQRRCVGL